MLLLLASLSLLAFHTASFSVAKKLQSLNAAAGKKTREELVPLLPTNSAAKQGFHSGLTAHEVRRYSPPEMPEAKSGLLGGESSRPLLHDPEDDRNKTRCFWLTRCVKCPFDLLAFLFCGSLHALDIIDDPSEYFDLTCYNDYLSRHFLQRNNSLKE